MIKLEEKKCPKVSHSPLYQTFYTFENISEYQSVIKSRAMFHTPSFMCLISFSCVFFDLCMFIESVIICLHFCYTFNK